MSAVDQEAQTSESERLRREVASKKRLEQEARRLARQAAVQLEVDARKRAEDQAGVGKEDVAARQQEAERIRLDAEARERAEAEAARQKMARLHSEDEISAPAVAAMNVLVESVHDVSRSSSTNGRVIMSNYSILNDRAPIPPARRSSLRIIFAVMITVVLLLAVFVGISKLRTDKPWTITQPASEPATSLAPSGMVYIPGTEFEMGSDQGDAYERPAHTQRIEPFFIDIDEVTCEAYSQFVKAKNYKSPPGWKGADYPAGSARKPVTGVTWYDALAYAKWAGKRLPTEAEWEYAARGPKGYRYPWGNEWRAGQANAEKAATGLSDVGTFKGVSQFGLRDMSGNAWEWTSTTMQAYPGGKLDEAQLPKEPREEVKVIRGGCYLSSAEQATTTYRYAWPAKGKYSFAQTGFRCARDAK